MTYVRRVACGIPSELKRNRWPGDRETETIFHPTAWLEDVSDAETSWTPDRERAARYFGAVEAHAAAEQARRLNAASLRKTGEVVRVLRARIKP